MPKMVSKTLNVTQVSYQTIAVNDGVPSFIPHPNAVFSGQIDETKAKRLLQAKLGKDAMFVITKVDAGQHRFEMPLDFFVLNANVADGGADDDENDETDEPEGDDTEAGDVGTTNGTNEEVSDEPTKHSQEKPLNIPASDFALPPDDPTDPAW